MEILCTPENSIFDKLSHVSQKQYVIEIGWNNSERSHWVKSNENNPITIGWTIKILYNPESSMFSPFSSFLSQK